MALRRTTGDIVCFLTQDAMPGDSYYESSCAGLEEFVSVNGSVE
jgi:hypothetical protein